MFNKIVIAKSQTVEESEYIIGDTQFTYFLVFRSVGGSVVSESGNKNYVYVSILFELNDDNEEDKSGLRLVTENLNVLQLINTNYFCQIHIFLSVKISIMLHESVVMCVCHCITTNSSCSMVPNSASRWVCQQYDKNVIVLREIMVGVSLH
jgi:hypothetical protein